MWEKVTIIKNKTTDYQKHNFNKVDLNIFNMITANTTISPGTNKAITIESTTTKPKLVQQTNISKSTNPEIQCIKRNKWKEDDHSQEQTTDYPKHNMNQIILNIFNLMLGNAGMAGQTCEDKTDNTSNYSVDQNITFQPIWSLS